MNIVDVVIILVAIASVARGYRIGLARQAGSTLGFVVGLFIGSWTANLIIDHLEGPTSKSLVSVLIVLGISFLFMTLGELVGIALKRKLVDKPVDKVDGSLGSVMAVVTVLFAAWLIGSILVLAPTSPFQQSVKGSAILSSLTRELPSATSFLTSFNKLIDPNGFPQVFTGLEPHPGAETKLPSLGSFDAVVTDVRPSVVKVESAACGGIVDGSGFVAGNGIVATNAHVVAGVKNPKVLDSNGIHDARVVWFDKNLDLAVLRVSDLAGKPLPLNTNDQVGGTGAVVLGYPGGGGFNAQSAVIVDRFVALGRDIYDQGITRREVYSVQAHIIPGNSGGPVVDADGQVVGVVFATSTQYNTIGYALTGKQVAGAIAQAQKSNTTYSTGACSE